MLFILVSVGAVYPIQVDGLVREYYTEEETILKRVLKKKIDCEFTIGNNREKDWSFTSLGDNLIIEADISSTEIIVFKAESRNGVELNIKDNILYHNETVVGPSLVISLYNPWELFGKKARLEGSIKIYHEYNTTVQTTKFDNVPGKVWTIWWMPFVF